jgi:Zn-finger nucleic acid-binding protein
MSDTFRSRRVLCPGCSRPMEIRDRHGVEIDQCRHCRGVWLDRGELDRIIERAKRFTEVSGEDKEGTPLAKGRPLRPADVPRRSRWAL